MSINCFKCGKEMIETRFTPVGELPPREVNPMSIYLSHLKGTDCNVENYVIQIGYHV